MTHPYQRQSGVKTPRTSALQSFTVYELFFELIARLNEGGWTTASKRQLLIVGRAAVEELAKRIKQD